MNFLKRFPDSRWSSFSYFTFQWIGWIQQRNKNAYQHCVAPPELLVLDIIFLHVWRFINNKWDEEMKSEMKKWKKKLVWTYVKPNLVLSQFPFLGWRNEKWDEEVFFYEGVKRQMKSEMKSEVEFNWRDDKWDKEMNSEMKRSKKISVWTYVKPILVSSQIPFLGWREEKWDEELFFLMKGWKGRWRVR